MKKAFLIFGFFMMLAPGLQAGDLKLDGINYDEKNPKESLAILNGELVKAGQEVDGYQVVKVETGNVYLKSTQSGEAITLNMNEEFKKAPPHATGAVAPQQGKAAVDQDKVNTFNRFHQKALAGGKTPLDKEVKKANFFESLMTQIQALSPMGGPAGAYQNFMNAYFEGRFDKAKPFVLSGSGADNLMTSRSKNIGACITELGKRFSAASYKVSSQTKKSETETQLEIIQTVRGDPPGVTSAFGSASVVYKHKAVMVKTSEGWKVKSFEYHAVADGGIGTGWLCVD